MNQAAKRSWALLHEPEGPLAPYLDLFTESLDEQGFKQRVIHMKIRTAANFSKWLHTRNCVALDVTNEHVQQFFKNSERRISVSSGEYATVRQLMDLLSQLGIIRTLPETNNPTPIQQAVDAFATYLREKRGLCDKTLIQYCPFVEHFLIGRFGHDPITFSILCAEDVIGFIKQRAEQLSLARAKSATTALRSFFRYLRYSGEIELDLAAAVPTTPNWTMSEIPRGIDPNHIQAIFDHCPRNTSVGRRDFAILKLLACLGLRAGEVVSLTLDSIDWEGGSITVVGKGNQVTSLPLPVEVGEAIADYLRHGRQISTSRALFLRALAPIRGLGAAQTVSTIVGAAIKRAGIETRYHGTHQFRHALATEMLRNGASLSEIGSILRHRQAKTTNLYAKVDFTALRPLSLPWPGGES